MGLLPAPEANHGRGVSGRERQTLLNPGRAGGAVEFRDLAPGPDPQLPLEAFERRRQRVAEALPDDGLMVVATHEETTYSNDVEHPFRPHSDFWYLTGFNEPGAVLLIDGSGGTEVFVREREPSAEIWTGRRLGVSRAAEALGVDAAHALDRFSTRLRDRIDGAVHAVTDHNAWVHRRLRRTIGKVPENGREVTSELRVRKDADEIRLLQRAADIGIEAMRDGASHIRPGAREYEVEAALVAAYRRAGSTGPGYPPIVGTGANAAVLHYIANRDAIAAGDLVLVDAGCEWGYYNSDITRTFPADGAFDGLAGQLYDVVERARAAALAAVRPGARLRAPHDAATRVLAQGMVELDLLTPEAIPEPDGSGGDGTIRRHFMHGTSHFLGLDVHDAGNYREPDGETRRLEEGMVITIEPGLYFNPDYAVCPPGTEGIGIRIEDDVVVTADGARNLTKALPTAHDAVEALVKVQPSRR